MEWTTILITLITTLIPTGGIIGFFTIREQKKAAKLENKAKEEEIKDKSDGRWEKLADQLNDQVEKLNTQIVDLNVRIEKKDELIQEKDDIISDLRAKLDSVRTKCSLATVMRCDSISCESRVPPISQALTGTFSEKLQNYVEGLGEE